MCLHSSTGAVGGFPAWPLMPLQLTTLRYLRPCSLSASIAGSDAADCTTSGRLVLLLSTFGTALNMDGVAAGVLCSCCPQGRAGSR
jgi:hypothetical protein